MEIRTIGEATGESGLVWGAASGDLNYNLVSWAAGEGVEAHVNNEVDVLYIVWEGAGRAEVDGETVPLEPGSVLMVPKGASRALRAGEGGLRYLTVHRRRPGLQLTARPPGGS